LLKLRKIVPVEPFGDRRAIAIHLYNHLVGFEELCLVVRHQRYFLLAFPLACAVFVIGFRVGKTGGITKRFFEVMGCPIRCGRWPVIDDVIKLLFQYLSVVLAKGRI
jgi:hypothetical protein